MSNNIQLKIALETLKSARQIADYAKCLGFSESTKVQRPLHNHLGAILADTILQAGLRYSTVVQPRVESIMQNYTHATTVSNLYKIVIDGKTANFLNWSHQEKLLRFETLVLFLKTKKINTIVDLRNNLLTSSFISELNKLQGIGPKSIDYMMCLVGIDSIAVDRHIRTFAKRAGLIRNDYEFLNRAFCSAADLLSISRRGFDYWVWNTVTSTNRKEPQQYQFSLQ